MATTGDQQGTVDQSGSRAVWDDVFVSELRVVNARRGRDLDARDELVGLAISGGGIRSATFALGILEGLKRLDKLRGIDYLSTVSGGGYIGAWLSANCKRHLGWLEPKADWSESIAHLRRHSNYLSPEVGFFSADTWTMVTIWLRNTLLIQVTVILAIAFLLMFPRPLFEIFEHWPTVGNFRWTTVLLFILGVVGIAGNHWRLTARKPLPLLRAVWWRRGLLLAVAGGLVAYVFGLVMGFAPFAGGEVRYAAALPIAFLLVAAGFCLQPVAVRLAARTKDRPEQINYTQFWAQAVAIVPLMGAAFLMAAILWGESIGLESDGHLARLDSYSAFFLTAWKYWPFPLSVVFASFWLLSVGGIRCDTTAGKCAAVATPFVAVLVLHALLCAVMLLLHSWARDVYQDGALKAFVWGPPLVALSFVLTVMVFIGMMGRQSTDDVREWWSRLGAWLGIYTVAWMVIAVCAVYGPQWVSFAIHSHPLKSLAAGGGWIGTIIGGLFAGKSESTGGEEVKGMGTKAKEVLAAVAPFAFIGGLLIVLAFLLDRLVATNADPHTWSSVALSATRHADHATFFNVSMVVALVCLIALLIMALRVDVNEFSLNAFYRNRLVRCYLGATRHPSTRNPQNFTGFDGRDDVALSRLVQPNLMVEPDPLVGPEPPPPPNEAPRLHGPLHIINCALNLGGSSDLALHTRHSANFILTPLYSGSRYLSREQTGEAKELGYVRSEEYGGMLGAPTLGQAISVSGAAASPNMGYHTSAVVAFMMTLFNARLGWWFPNPAKDTGRPTPYFSLRYLFAELFGGANDKSSFVMISDGGHFENMAAYELVKRRCRLIIISDGECDPTLAFGGLGTLIRMCEVDCAARITIDVSAIRAGGTQPWSTRRWAVGSIEYDDGTSGTLIYLKASMTGAEDTSVLQYKSAHKLFPHESTGDQFYGEDQFESYRRLGRELAAEAFSES